MKTKFYLFEVNGYQAIIKHNVDEESIERVHCDEIKCHPEEECCQECEDEYQQFLHELEEAEYWVYTGANHNGLKEINKPVM